VGGWDDGCVMGLPESLVCVKRLPESLVVGMENVDEEDGAEDSDDAFFAVDKGYLYMRCEELLPQLHLPNVASHYLASSKVEKAITRTNRHVGHNVRRPLSFSLCAFQSSMYWVKRLGSTRTSLCTCSNAED